MFNLRGYNFCEVIELNFKIFATIKDFSIARELLNAGVTAFRVNSSHMEIGELIEFLEEYQFHFYNIPLYIDLKGSKKRLRKDQRTVELIPGEKIVFATSESPEIKTLLVEPAVLKLLSPNLNVSLNDGKIKLKILDNDGNRAYAIVLKAGRVHGAKGINFEFLSDKNFRSFSLTEKDVEIISKTRDYPFVRYALSFVSSPEQIKNLRAISRRYVAAKIENYLDLDKLKEISSETDEIWFCRGDLGAHLGMRGLAKFYGEFVKSMRVFTCPVFMAGEVMEHMVDNPRPTRSEICHLYDLIEHGFSGIVLSNETVSGNFPIEVVKVVREVISGD
jgi:pyruvate kinase